MSDNTKQIGLGLKLINQDMYERYVKLCTDTMYHMEDSGGCRDSISNKLEEP